MIDTNSVQYYAERRGMNAATLSRLSHTSLSTIKRIYRQEQTTVDTLIQIAKCLNVRVGDLLSPHKKQKLNKVEALALKVLTNQFLPDNEELLEDLYLQDACMVSPLYRFNNKEDYYVSDDSGLLAIPWRRAMRLNRESKNVGVWSILNCSLYQKSEIIIHARCFEQLADEKTKKTETTVMLKFSGDPLNSKIVRHWWTIPASETTQIGTEDRY